MRKNILSVILVIVMVTALMLSVTGCGSNDLKEENAALKAQVEELTQRLAAYENRPALVEWTLEGSAWSSNNGATVTVTTVYINWETHQRFDFVFLHLFFNLRIAERITGNNKRFFL